MSDIRFIEHRDKVEVVERRVPFERRSDLFWREYGWQTQVSELHNGGRPAESVSRQTVHVLDGSRCEIKSAADV